MPKFIVIEQRMNEVTYLIESPDEDSARRLAGDIIEENGTDSWGYDIVSVEAADADVESL